jgi:eukaryotic-like serine/threonine-protein kinase
MDIIGKVLSNRYEVIEEIGVGGMAYVYKAKCKLLNRNVAVKVLKPEYSKDDTFVKRFRTEAQAAASLTHPNIVSVYDVGEEEGINYIVMELLESRTLKDYIEEKGALSNDETIKISTQIASALEAAHKEHVVHRDIKPQNIVLGSNLVAKVTDFGIAKVSTTATITNFGSTMGSVHYFSPEHAKGGYTDEKSDIYSLGVVMYEMATGKVPFDADSPISVALKHIQESPVEPKIVNDKITEDLNKIILKAMAKSTINRYKNSTELLNDLKIANNTDNKRHFVEAGATQIIPTLDEEIIEENFVPNLRTVNRRANVVSTRSSNKTENEKTNDVINDNNTDKDEDIIVSKKFKLDKKYIKYIVIASVILVIFLTTFIVKIVNKINSDSKPAVSYEVPNLVGRNFEEVVNEYKSQGIEILQDKLEYDKDIKEGCVISQTPNKGTSTTDRKIYVIVSKGQKTVEVPDVTAKDIKVVKYELQDTLGFVIEIEEVVSDKVLSNIVISQEPKAKEVVPYGSTIKLKVSKGDGKAKVLMPNLDGNTESVAKKTLTDLKLVPNVKYGEDKTKSNGVVIKQSYPVNQELKEGDLVEITINKLLLTKTISLDLQQLQNNNPSNDDIIVRVVASIDGSAENTVFEKTFEPLASRAEFTLNGYSTANLKIFINQKQVSTQVIDFTK